MTGETPRRGRPVTGKAIPPARRMRALREKALTAVLAGQDLASLSDTALLHAVPVVYRRGQAEVLRQVADELVRRATAREVQRG